MSAEGVLHAALVTALREGLGDALNGVFDGPPVKASLPYAEVQPLIAIDWSAKDWTGRELRPAVTIMDAGDTPTRLHALIGTTCMAIETMPETLDGWRIASLIFVRSRMLREAPGRWTAQVEYRARMRAI
jgi:hypothetical protein